MVSHQDSKSGLAFQADFFQNRCSLWQVSQLFDRLPNVCFFAKDNESRFVRMNALNLELYGLDDESLILGKTDRDFHPPALAEAYIAEDQRVMESKSAISDQTWLVPYLDGRLQWFVSSKTPLVDSDGQIAGIAGAMFPIEAPSEEIARFKQLAPAVRYLDAHFAESTPLSKIAEMCGLSLTHFNRLFQSLLQMSPSHYRTALRVQRVRVLLRTSDESITNIAIDAGFCDQSHLTKQFRKATGMTPTLYRRTFGKARQQREQS